MLKSNVLRAALLFVVGANFANAQEWEYIGEYTAQIGSSDIYNSSGQRLSTVCAVLQQDRANYHRFGVRDPLDQGDRFFDQRSNRNVIGQRCFFAPGQDYLAGRILNGGIAIQIQVYGWGPEVHFIDIAGPAG